MKEQQGQRLNLAWGAKAIGEEIGRTGPQVHYMLGAGLIRSARRIGKRWIADRDDLRREFSDGRPADSVTRSGHGIDGAG